jgi:AcrR family transcriptional regulator
VLAAARDSFANEGPDVPLDVIAARAGVGPGTVHRHFPTKESLIAAVVTDRLAGLAARAGSLAGAVDPTASFVAFIRELTAEARQNVVLNGALGGAGIGVEGAEAATVLSSSLGQLLERAQGDGGVREDLTVPDLHAILSGVIAMERNLSADHQGIGLEIVIDGLTKRLPRTLRAGYLAHLRFSGEFWHTGRAVRT